MSLKWNIQLERSLEEGWPPPPPPPPKKRGLAHVHVRVHWDAGPFPTGGALDGRDDVGTNLARLVGAKQVTGNASCTSARCLLPTGEVIIVWALSIWICYRQKLKLMEYGQCERQLGFPHRQGKSKDFPKQKWPNWAKEVLKWHKNISKKEEWLKVADYSGHSWYIRGQVLTSCLT